MPEIEFADLDEKTKEEFFKRHTHAEIVYDQNPDQIVYREKDVIELVNLISQRDAIGFAKWFNYEFREQVITEAGTGDGFFYRNKFYTESELYQEYLKYK